MRRVCAIPAPNGVVMRGPAESEEYVYCSVMRKIDSNASDRM